METTASTLQTRRITEPDVPELAVLEVIFDRPDSSANTLDLATLHALDDQLKAIETDSTIRAVVFTSAKKSIFIAGADFELLSQGPSSKELLEEYLALGQGVFNRLAALNLPTVAAIHGACLGGGYELALACRYRIATPDKVTRIGLPETRLGIIPAWGGTTRLPRLVGIPRALDLILNGKTPSARQALRYGMVDELAPREWLLRAALKAIRAHKADPKGPRNVAANFFHKAVALGVQAKVRSDLMRKTRGNYPAPLKAMEIILEGAGESELSASLARERAAIAELVQQPQARNLFHVFMLQEAAKKQTRECPGPAVEQAAVIGAGVMGAGIAQWLSARGIRVILRDIDREKVAAGVGRIGKLYREGVRRHTFTEREARDGQDRIIPAPEEVPLEHVGLVIEAAVEKLEIKRALFGRLEERVRPGTILATNTSALPVHEIAKGLSHPERVLGLHFFNPVHRMPLVEVVLPEGVSSEAHDAALRFIGQIGKLPLVVKDTPGFLVNRVLVPYLVEAAEAFESGASASDIDEAMLNFGFPMGPLRLVDEVGLDIALEVAETLARAYPDRMHVPEILRKMVKAGDLGKKAGRGFYLHRKGKTAVNMAAYKMRRTKEPKGLDMKRIQWRMVFQLLDEAARCLEEQVVRTAGEVDFGMIMGTGFPPFRGGPLRYIDQEGAYEIARRMNDVGITPCAMIQDMAAKHQKFYEANRA